VKLRHGYRGRESKITGRSAARSEVKRKKEAKRIYAKRGRRSEVVGKRSSVYSVGVLAITRMNGVEAKLTKAARIATDEFDFVDCGRKLANAVGLKHADENHSAIGEHMPEGDVFACEIVPGEIGFLDEEDLGLIPARDFDAIAVRSEESFRDKHGHLREKVSRFQARESGGRH